MSEAVEKLTKKQRKALEFKNKTKGKVTEESTSDESKKDSKKRSRDEEDNKKTTEDEPAAEGDEEPKKKRKTRRGKKGKGSGSSGPRFLIFVGNLPYDITDTELLAHFSRAGPDRVRLRSDKGIAFLEFDSRQTEIQHKMEVALRMHHSTLRNRKINVELTVGGGGNSSNRLEKIKEKNGKLDVERNGKIEEKKKQVKEKKLKNAEKEAAPKIDLTNVHPDRAKLMR
jgi:nucleolar protein 6